MIADSPHHARLVEAATVTELHHFALGTAFAPRVAMPEELSTQELEEAAKTLATWKSADKALAEYHAHRRNVVHDDPFAASTTTDR
jgi:leucyl aminopeptidase